jgi:hypothetical protein
MNYLARKPIINFDLYSTPFSRIREEKVSGSTKRDRPASVFRKKAMPGFDDSTYKSFVWGDSGCRRLLVEMRMIQ